ncbi:hypothetical protein EDC94DRAFT_605619 [Helicostylum pulchrum]|nr:hypothetical protein EDC94DRAFT_605619 [Helicostylum pulchrum]
MVSIIIIIIIIIVIVVIIVVMMMFFRNDSLCRDIIYSLILRCYISIGMNTSSISGNYVKKIYIN